MILEVKLEGRTYVAKASTFEEFTTKGPYCELPWLRIKSVLDDYIVECPLDKITYIKRV